MTITNVISIKLNVNKNISTIQYHMNVKTKLSNYLSNM